MEWVSTSLNVWLWTIAEPWNVPPFWHSLETAVACSCRLAWLWCWKLLATLKNSLIACDRYVNVRHTEDILPFSVYRWCRRLGLLPFPCLLAVSRSGLFLLGPLDHSGGLVGGVWVSLQVLMTSLRTTMVAHWYNNM